MSIERRDFTHTHSPKAFSTGTLLSIPDIHPGSGITETPCLRVVHLTDVHIRPEYDAPERFRAMLRYIRLTNPDISLYLNGGGTVYTPRGEAVPRERIEEEWRLWKECIAAEVPDVTMMSCLGDDDLRWAGEAEDPLRGKPYVQRQLETPSTYYSFTRNGWLFCMLDSNHANGSLGEEQMAWLKTELEHSRNLPVLVVSHYPLVAFSTIPDRSGIHQDWEEIIALFNANPNVKLCLSGHTHLLDRVWYNGVKYCCNGSASGYWWEAGDDGKSSYKQTPPGYALVDLFADGRSRCEYIPFPHGSISDNAF